jgi:PAS domain S-box-containing protein
VNRIAASAATAADLVQQTLLGEAVEECPAAIFVLDDAGHYLAVNQYACDLLGYPREELLTLHPQDLAPDSDVEAALAKLVQEGSLAGRTRVRTKDGRTIPMTYRSCSTHTGGTEMWICVAFPE